MKAYVNNSSKRQKEPLFRKDQELIWDSGAGFDVVSFKKTSKLFNGTWVECKLITGEKKGQVIPIEQEQLKEFSLKRWAEMRRRYDNAC
jgi:hypothetical protein